MQQVYTGFFMLHQRGLIDLSQEILPIRKGVVKGDKSKRRFGPAHLSVTLNDDIRLHYDARDGKLVDSRCLGELEFYFKRSYSRAYIESLGEIGKKVHPLGLNYAVFPSGFDRFAVKRSWIQPRIGQRMVDFARTISLLDRVRFTPRVHLMQAPPDNDVPPRMLFMARAFDPNADPTRPAERSEEKEQINESRANTIRLLRDEFGSRFHGGFIRTDFAVKRYPGLLLPDDAQSSQKNYLNQLRSYSICVATTGLRGSIGWKFAEYVAFSKSIVSEKLNFEVPGDLEKGRNYLEFGSPDECVEQAVKLFSDPELRSHLMSSNARYYQAFMRPDELVLRSLRTALQDETVKGNSKP